MASPAPDTAAKDPLLSVVVTVVEGGGAMREFLAAITDQEMPPPLDVIVPYDASISNVAALSQEFPAVRFLELGEIETERPVESAAGQHELYDRRRAAGLAAAQGALIAILEDRGVPQRNWARTAVLLHQTDSKVIGGAIDCAPCGLLNWAFYVCDFGRYSPPLETGPRAWVSDVNITYKREALEATRDLWQDRYQEPIVHWALIEQGETLLLSSELVVSHRRPPTTLGMLLPERFHWGRLFGAIRAKHMSPMQRWAYSIAGPIIPFVLVVRHGLTQAGKGRLLRYLLASPLVIVLLCAWTSGEVWGYVTRQP